jgi:hypothetical protein
MADPADLTARVAEVLDKHWLQDYAEDAAPGYDCSCGEDFTRLDDYTGHVAAAVVAELGLTEEEGADFTFGGRSRWVTPWVDDVVVGRG